MGKPTFQSDEDQIERVVHKRNIVCCRRLLRALQVNHGDAAEVLEVEPEPEPECPAPKLLLPISNAVFRDASNFADEISRGFSEVIRVLRAVSAHTGVSISDMRSERREQRVVRPRQYVYYLSRKLTASSMPAIGRQLSKDHTSVLSGIRKMEKLRLTNPKIESDLQIIATSLGGSLA